jgi:hypothetical protein
MRTCTLSTLLLAVVLVLGSAGIAGGQPGGVRQTMETHPHGTVPVFRWDACETENLKECGSRKAVVSLVVGVGLNCTFMPAESSGLARALAGDAIDPRRHLWQISAAPGKTLQPPVVYGILPEGAVQDWPPDGRAPQRIPANCEYVTFAGDGAAMVDAVQKNLDRMAKANVDPFAGADPVGTHAVQKLAGKQECFLGANRMVLASGVTMDVPTLMRRATDGATVVEDSLSISPGQKAARTAYRYTADADGKYAMTQIGGTAKGAGTYVPGPDHWASWTVDIEFAGAGTRVQGDVTRSEGTLVTRGAILAGGKAVMTYGATLERIDEAECEALFSRVPPLAGL